MIAVVLSRKLCQMNDMASSIFFECMGYFQGYSLIKRQKELLEVVPDTNQGRIMKTVEKVFETLKTQGLIPSMEEYGIAFRYQMANFIYMPDKEDEKFFNMLIPGIYVVSEENEYDVLRAINSVNNAMKVVKLVISGDSVWVCFESELSEDAPIDELVPFAVVTLFQARVRFYDALKMYIGENVFGMN